MKLIYMEDWEITAFEQNRKSSKRIVLNPQPMMDEHGMWHWKDCQWMNGGLGFPQSGIEDNFFHQPGDFAEVLGPEGSPKGYIRITSICVEQLCDMTDTSAEKEGCQGTFSGTGESCGSGWKTTPQDEFAKLWDASMDREHQLWFGWNTNPWVEVIEFEQLSEKPEDSDNCEYCTGKTRTAFRCNVQTAKEGNLTKDIPVPVLYCPHCGRSLT